MRHLLQQDILLVLWIGYALYWALTALRQGRAKTNQSQFALWLYVVIGAIAFVLLFQLRDRVATLLIFLGLFYGILAIVGRERTKQRESLSARLPHVAAMIAAFVLLFETSVRLGPLSHRFLPDSQAAAPAGVLLTACGLTLAVWARTHLSTNWSANIVIRARHSLVRTGPYAHLRHPIYSGLLLAISGTALAQGEWRGLVALSIVVAAFSIKAKREEALLQGEFGIEFNDYAQHAGFFLPRLTRHRVNRYNRDVKTGERS